MRVKIGNHRHFFILGVVCAALSGCGISESTEKKERQLFDQIKKGMHRSEVIKILGEPDDTTHGINSSGYEYDFFKDNNSMRSDFPTVVFDSTDKVVFASYGD